MKSYINRKKVRLQFQKIISKAKVMNQQEKLQRARSFDSQRDDPVLPEDHHLHNKILCTGNFKSRYNP